MKKILFAILLFVPLFAQGITIPEVAINEVAWMGTTTSANDEWIELKNTSDQEINLDGWLLKTTDGKMKIYLTGKISAHSFYLLERSDDATVPNIKADQIYTGALSNTGQSLELSRNSQTLIDSFAFTSQWPAGDNSTKQTMERTPEGIWQTSNHPNGTPKLENSGGKETSPKEVIAKEVATPAPPVNYPSGVIITELLPSPEGADDTGEWIEVHNTNAFSVDISGWKLKDKEGAGTAYAITATALAAQGYVIFKRPQTNITLNNEVDGVTLLWPNEKVVDSVSYIKAPTGQSYSKAASWQWSTAPTPGMPNVITTPRTTSLQKQEKVGNSRGVASVKDTVASLPDAFSEKLEGEGANPWILFAVALGIAVASAVVILLIKLNLFKKNHVRS